MGNLKLAAKMAIGFGLVIAVAIAPGGIAVLSMIGAQGDARRLSSETVPQVDVANNLERSAHFANFYMRGVATRATDLIPARQYMADTQKYIADAEALASKFPRLTDLKKNMTDAKSKVDEYAKLAENIEAKSQDVAGVRADLDGAAATFIKLADSLLAEQKAKARGGADPRRLSQISGINELVILADNLHIANLRGEIAGDPAIVNTGLESFKRSDEILKTLSATADGEDRAALVQLRDVSSKLMTSSQTLLDDLRNISDLTASGDKAAQAVLNAAMETSQAGFNDARTITNLTVTRLYTAILMLLAGLGAAALIGIATAFAITRSILGPLNQGVAFAQRVASGDFSGQLAIRQRDEVGNLVQSLNAMAGKLKETVITVQDNATQVASISEEISTHAQKLAEGSQMQASTLEETSASVEELSASVDLVSRHAQSQSMAVQKGSVSMEQVQKSIEAVSASLKEISALARKSMEDAVEGAKSVESVVNGISMIADSSEKIGGIVDVISDIADQTELLSLNASIEAARAGENGRGFAVVAAEVSKLAERSAASTKEITALIKESGKSVSEGVRTAKGSKEVMEQIRDASEQVNGMIMGLSEAMSQEVSAIEQLADALKNISEMSRSISAATQEQTTSAQQAAKAVESVNDLTQAAASSVEEMSAAMVEMSRKALALQRLVQQFKVERDEEQSKEPLAIPQSIGQVAE
jgi:methyl-accepting chemotaxis protein